MNPEERDQLIQLYARGYEMLLETLENTPSEMWKFQPASGEWSVHEIIIHLADSEAIAAQQARMMVAEPGGTVMAYDPAAWATNLEYLTADIDDALNYLDLTRRFTTRWLSKLPDSAFASSVIYPGDEEPYTLDALLAIYANHIPDHIGQIQNNVAAWQATQ